MDLFAVRPDDSTLYRAFVEKDASFEGIAVMAVRTTGIFCRPTCPARKPKMENVEFFPRAGDALAAGYRPCLRCNPMAQGGSVPDWIQPIFAAVDADPGRRWTTDELRELGVEPARARRWFQSTHGMTLSAFLRSRRLGEAFSRIKGGSNVEESAEAADFQSLSGFRDAFHRQVGHSPSSARDICEIRVDQLPSPLGPIVIAAAEEGVLLVEFWDRRMLDRQFEILRNRLGATIFPGTNEVIRSMKRELEEYFQGTLRSFSTPVQFPGSPHQTAVWSALQEVPYGQTLTYGQLAAQIGRPTAVRPVARAVGENRLAIVIPCHRIVGANGDLTGYGGGLWRKRYLLGMEGAPAGS